VSPCEAITERFASNAGRAVAALSVRRTRIRDASGIASYRAPWRLSSTPRRGAHLRHFQDGLIPWAIGLGPMRWGAVILLGLAVVGGCGGSARTATSLGAARAFFTDQGGSSPVAMSASPGQYVDEANLRYHDPSGAGTDCTYWLSGPSGGMKVTLVQVTCVLISAHGFPNSCPDCRPAASLVGVTVRRFAPSAVAWADQLMQVNVDGPFVRAVSATRTVGGGETVQLSVYGNPLPRVTLRITSP